MSCIIYNCYSLLLVVSRASSTIMSKIKQVWSSVVLTQESNLIIPKLYKIVASQFVQNYLELKATYPTIFPKSVVDTESIPT